MASKVTTLSRPTVRSCCSQRMVSRSTPCSGTKALVGSAGGRVQRRKDSDRGLAGPELSVEQARGRVVDDGEERLALVRAAAQPDMGTAIEMQQLAHAGAGLATAPMAAARAPLAHEPGFLQGEPDEAIGERHRVIAPGKAIEVADVPAGEALAVQPQDALDLGGRGLAPRRAHPAPIIQRHRPAGLIAGAPAPHAAWIEAQDVGGL